MTHTYTVYAITSAGGMAQFVHRVPHPRFSLVRLRSEMEATCLLIARVERGTLVLDTPTAECVIAFPNRRNDACCVARINLN